MKQKVQQVKKPIDDKIKLIVKKKKECSYSYNF